MHKVLVVFIVIPKNSRLNGYKDIIKNLDYSKIIEARGEDVPFWIEQLTKKGKKAIGITGEDLYKEYCLKENKRLNILKKVRWNDSAALFRKPTLCLIGPKDMELTTKKRLNICISKKYKNIAKSYLLSLEKTGFRFNKCYINGCIEQVCSEGIADLVIDIVYTGSSIKKENLKIYDKILESDFLIIGGKND